MTKHDLAGIDPFVLLKANQSKHDRVQRSRTFAQSVGLQLR